LLLALITQILSLLKYTIFPYTTLFRSTNLKCSVTNCVYNDSNLCSKDEINVGGEHAKEQSCTCCESFCNCNHASASAKNVCQTRSEEHTSELQSRFDLVCRLLLEKKQQ